MAEEKKSGLIVDAVYDIEKNAIKIPVTSIENGEFALRVFPEKSKHELLYKSTRAKSLVQAAEGFECNGMPGILNCSFEIKNINTKEVVVAGLIKSEMKQTKKKVEAVNQLIEEKEKK